MNAEFRKHISNLKVDEYTTRSTINVKPGAHYADLLRLMQEKGVRHLPVVDEGKVVGIISERNLKLPTDVGDFIDMQARDIMTRDPYTVFPETPLEEVAFELSRRKIGSAIVEDGNGHILGIFTTTDALNALIEVIRGEY